MLNGNYPVAKKTRDKVIKAVETVGYRPNVLAKSLKTNKTYTVGLVVPDISNVYFMNIAKGVESVISEHGYTLALGSSSENESKELKLLQAFKDKRFDYCILASCLKDSKKLNELIDDNFKVIMVDTYLPGLNTNFVVENNEKYSYILTDYFIKKGHKNIVFVNGIEHISTAAERYNGFLKAIEDNKIDFDRTHYIDGGYETELAYKKVKNFLKNHKPTIIYATNNRMAEGSLRAIKEMGFKVPDDISFVSYGDIDLSELIEPKLTIIDQNAYNMGVVAGEIIASQRKEKRTYTVKSKFMKRGSVKDIR